jgi:hypothetical protein
MDITVASKLHGEPLRDKNKRAYFCHQVRPHWTRFDSSSPLAYVRGLLSDLIELPLKSVCV